MTDELSTLIQRFVEVAPDEWGAEITKYGSLFMEIFPDDWQRGYRDQWTGFYSDPNPSPSECANISAFLRHDLGSRGYEVTVRAWLNEGGDKRTSVRAENPGYRHGTADGWGPEPELIATLKAWIQVQEK